MDLSERLKKAREAGTRAAEAVPDTGTCCMDFVWLPRSVARPTVASGLGLASAFFLRSKGWEFSGGAGQAGKRTAFCEAAAKELQDLGARVVYIMD